MLINSFLDKVNILTFKKIILFKNNNATADKFRKAKDVKSITELKMEILSTELLFQKQNPLVEAAILNTSTVQRFLTDIRP